MKVILSDWSKFQKLSIDQNKVLNHIVHMENRITDILKKLKNQNIISEKKYEDLYSVSSWENKLIMKIFILLGFYRIVLKFLSLLKMVFHLTGLFY